MISLTCEACHGVMDVDEGREILTCPYCGSKKLIPVSDEVKIEQIKQSSILEQKKLDMEKDKQDIKVALVMIAVPIIICIIMVIVFH